MPRRRTTTTDTGCHPGCIITVPTAPVSDADYRPGMALAWMHAAHWGGRSAPCAYCGKKTRLRDEVGDPAHKVCAERALLGLQPPA